MMKKKNRRKRVERRIPRRRPGARKPLLAGFFLFLVLIVSAGVWLLAVLLAPFFTMPAIPVEWVMIDGSGPLDSAVILRKAGISRNTNIMELDLVGAAAELSRREPYIRNAKIIRNPAEGSIRISLRLRSPAAFVRAAGSLYAVDREGFVIGGIGKVDFRDLPVITGIDDASPEPGRLMEEERIRTALELLRLASETGLDGLFPVSEVNMSAARHIIIYAGEDGMQLRLTGENPEEKMREAAAIAAYLRQNDEKAEYIDLRFRRAIVKPR